MGRRVVLRAKGRYKNVLLDYVHEVPKKRWEEMTEDEQETYKVDTAQEAFAEWRKDRG